MATDPQRKSYAQTLIELGPRQQEVLALLDAFDQRGGLSAWEIADLTKRLVHAVRPRICELRKLGLVREAGERWEPRTERHEAVWKVAAQDADGQMLIT
jgi:predicted transcriptional regulator